MKPLDEEKKEKILNAVYLIAAQNGLNGISISAISKKAGIGVGTVYTYFHGKEEIIQSAYEQVKDNFSKYTFKGVKTDAPYHSMVRKIYINALRYRLKYFEETVFIDLYNQSNYIKEDFKNKANDFIIQNKPFYALLKTGIEQGIFEKTSRAVIISFVFSAARETSIGILQGILPLNKRTINDNFNMVWKGISK